MNNTCQNKSFGVLHPGVRYRVKKEFYDYNGERYQVDEEMVFIDHNFIPYESGLSLFSEHITESFRSCFAVRRAFKNTSFMI